MVGAPRGQADALVSSSAVRHHLRHPMLRHHDEVDAVFAPLGVLPRGGRRRRGKVPEGLGQQEMLRLGEGLRTGTAEVFAGSIVRSDCGRGDRAKLAKKTVNSSGQVGSDTITNLNADEITVSRSGSTQVLYFCQVNPPTTHST